MKAFDGAGKLKKKNDMLKSLTSWLKCSNKILKPVYRQIEFLI